MSLLDKTANFVKQLNSMVKSISVDDGAAMHQVDELRRRIQAIIEQTSSAEARAMMSLERLCQAEACSSEPLYVRKDGRLRAVVALDMIKPKITAVQKVQRRCDCAQATHPLFERCARTVYIGSEAELVSIDRGLDCVCIEVFDHDYRSFHGFTCFIAVYTPDGLLYVIDTIKFRETIPRLRLLGCGVRKLFHCEQCAERLTADFGGVGCAWCLGGDAGDVYVDWRIRPVNATLLGVISESMARTVEKVNSDFSCAPFTHCETDELQQLSEKLGVSPLSTHLQNLIKLRNYLALKYDEGQQYVFTDEQMLAMLEARPATREEFEQLFPKMSSVLRIHIGDCMIVLNKKLDAFSLESLKVRGADSLLIAEEEEADLAAAEAGVFSKYRSFADNSRAVAVHREESSEFQISSD
ncbi:hypothetical protein PAPHI01_0729 [Pancytospora philotis]|nr:hypothetical protein PAPHI01_0729 [Pancytospora philotis]